MTARMEGLLLALYWQIHSLCYFVGFGADWLYFLSIALWDISKSGIRCCVVKVQLSYCKVLFVLNYLIEFYNISVHLP